jgi:hypothetical protein
MAALTIPEEEEREATLCEIQDTALFNKLN